VRTVREHLFDFLAGPLGNREKHDEYLPAFATALLRALDAEWRSRPEDYR